MDLAARKPSDQRVGLDREGDENDGVDGCRAVEP
jgi:hypothetical protein